MIRTAPEDWRPVGIENLEAAADDAVRSMDNRLVISGPGGGKTEVLAQRAHYLLTTGLCPPPIRILSIAFKRDAAKNLKDRVHERCGEVSHRFDSWTLDGFAKGLVDRFRLGLPASWRPRPNYEVRLIDPHPEEIRTWIHDAGSPEGYEPLKAQALSNRQAKDLAQGFMHGHRLPPEDADLDPRIQHLSLRWWQDALTAPQGTPSLTFPMLNRLAALVLRKNPKLLHALRQTYGFVFLDEFQDTTGPQYDLVATAFESSSSVVTAVGDSKQRIMLWAGALPDAISRFQEDFNAQESELVMNHRASPELLDALHVIATAVEEGTSPPTPTREVSGGGCTILEFQDHEAEADELARRIHLGITEEQLDARDFCVMAKQKVSDITQPLKAALASRGIPLRDESQLQNLLAEPVVELILWILRLATRRRDPEAWHHLFAEVARLHGLHREEDASRIERRSTGLVNLAREHIANRDDIAPLPGLLVERLGTGHLVSTYRRYMRGSYLDSLLERLGEALEEYDRPGRDKAAVVDDLRGVGTVPAMTIHKSKGLEFHTVIFVGLDDSQWWSFSGQSDEDKRAFFVAFSRAMDRVYFTFSDVRNVRGSSTRQSREGIRELYEILHTAGTEIERFP